jgi:hypothetical protein
VGINAEPCAVERMDATVTAYCLVMPSTLLYSFLCFKYIYIYIYIYIKRCKFCYVPNSCMVICNQKLSYKRLILHK